MVNGFLELTKYPAHWVCAIFEDFVPVLVGLDGLVLGSNYETLCFGFQPSCFEPLFSHLLAYIFLAYSVWVLPMHLFLFLFLLNLLLSMTLCIFLHFPSMGGWSSFFKLRLSGRLSSLLKISAQLGSYRVIFLLFLIMSNNPVKGIIFGVTITI